MATAVAQRLKLLEKQIGKTNSLNTELSVTLNALQYRLSMIPWWKYTVVLLVYWMIKIYLQTGWTAIASLGVSFAAYTQLIFVLPRISDNIQDRIIPMASDSHHRISHTVTVMNQEVRKNRMIFKKNPEITKTINSHYKPINLVLSSGEHINGKLIGLFGQHYCVLVIIEGKEVVKRYEKGSVVKTW